jgi:hypothetical protein
MPRSSDALQIGAITASLALTLVWDIRRGSRPVEDIEALATARLPAWRMMERLSLQSDQEHDLAGRGDLAGMRIVEIPPNLREREFRMFAERVRAKSADQGTVRYAQGVHRFLQTQQSLAWKGGPKAAFSQWEMLRV